MFERFTARGRSVLVYASDEARLLNHNYIGTEHLLLALLRDEQSVAFAVLRHLGATGEAVRAAVVQLVGRGPEPRIGHIPFTPRAKTVLETALRESLRLNHNYIGTEHILLGLSQGDGIAATILADFGSTDTIRDTVKALLPAEAPGGRARRFVSPLAGSGDDDALASPKLDAILAAARAAAGDSRIGSHHVVAAALQDDNSAAVKALRDLGVDVAALQQRLADADIAGTSDEAPEDVGRRQLMLRLDDDHAVLDIGDPRLVAKVRAVIDARPASVDGVDGASEPVFRDLWLAIAGVLDALIARRDD